MGTDFVTAEITLDDLVEKGFKELIHNVRFPLVGPGPPRVPTWAAAYTRYVLRTQNEQHVKILVSPSNKAWTPS